MATDELNLTSLRVFVDVVATGSFTAAGERHGMSQPAVSFHIRQLETRFDVPLLERAGRRARPTAAGAELLRHAHRVIASADDVTVAMAAFRPDRVGVVRIGAVATACVAVVPRVLRRAREAVPSLEFVVTTGLSPEIVASVDGEGLDIGIVTLPARGEMVEATPGCEDEIVLLAGAESGLQLRDRVPASALRDRPPMLLQSTGATRTLIDAWFATAGVPFHPPLALGSIEAVIDLVEMGIGSAMLSRMALANRPLPEGVTIHRLSPPIRRTMGRVMRRDRVHDPNLALLATLIDRELAALERDRE
ncbi:MAG: LysR family transcriptional regulator [Thermomicrobiales bacterium]